MSLADHVRTLGRGPGRARSLSRDEATDAMRRMLSGEAAPEAVGALLMLLRMKGETADEIAGFAQAAQDSMDPVQGVDLDWPSYAAGRTRGAPWFLLAARLVAMSGRRVLIHGWNGRDAQVRASLDAAGVPVAADRGQVGGLLDRHGIAYLPLEHAHDGLFRLLSLRDVLGLRSSINTVCRMLNPGRAPASVQGVFHPSYRLLQADAATALGWRALTIIKGGGGEFERNPAKPIDAFGLRDHTPWRDTLPPLISETRRLSATTSTDLTDLWQGAAAPFEERIVLGTAALALATLGDPTPAETASRLWARRLHQRAA